MEPSTGEQDAAREYVRRLARRRRRQETLRKQTDAEFYAAIRTAKGLGVGATLLARDADVTRDGIYKILQLPTD